ncbi:MAG: HigA family addiction module antitoxin [Dehalococcoidia bacterium]
MTKKELPPIHPGEVLREDFMEPLGLTPYRVAKDIGVPQPRIYDLVRERRAISADTALRLGEYFGVTPQFWMNLQAKYDLDKAEDMSGDAVKEEVKVLTLPR